MSRRQGATEESGFEEIPSPKPSQARRGNWKFPANHSPWNEPSGAKAWSGACIIHPRASDSAYDAWETWGTHDVNAPLSSPETHRLDAQDALSPVDPWR